MEASGKLKNAGRMQWVRFGNTQVNGGTRPYHNRARNLGLNIFSVISLEQLGEKNWEQTFDRFYSNYSTDIWQIGNEISNPDIHVNPLGATTIEQFFPKFRELYGHVKRKYPQAVLAGPPTFGSVGGPAELEKFFQLGLLDLDVVVTLNLYTETALQEYGVVFDRYRSKLTNKRIWVTETGAGPPERHIDWVNNFYPRIINALHPEMVCWYVMWGGDSTANVHDNDSGLLDNLERGPVIERDLFKALIGSK